MWYHVSNNYLGQKFLFSPNVPKNKQTDIEGNIPRICVSNSIYKCLRAKEGFEYIWIGSFKKFNENPSVYFTEEEPYIPPECNDFRDNDERWFLKPTVFYYLARIDIYTLFRYHKIIPTNETKCMLPKSKPYDYIYNKDCKEIFMQILIKGHKNDKEK